jgi:glycolate oxidase iron-sulfur subunit
LLGLYRRLHGLLPQAWRPLPRPPAAISTQAVSTQAVPGARTASEHALFVGCVAKVFETPTRDALSRLFATAGVMVSIPAGQTCCGAAAVHAGDIVAAERLAAANRGAFAQSGSVLCLATGCLAQLRNGLAGTADARDALVALDSLGDRLAFRDARDAVVAVHVPCTQFGSAGSVGALRRLLARVPGLRVVELPDTGCCGAAGLHMLAEPARAAALRAPLLEAFARSGAGQLLSTNIGCRLHLGNALTAPVRHPVDFLAEHLA